MKNKTKLLKELILILVISLGIITVLESVLRIIYPNKSRSLFDSVAYEFNDNYLIALKSGIKKEFQRNEEDGGYISRWTTNNDGFRGPSLRDTPKYRIIVYGDSNIQARFSGQKRTFPEQLARFLEESGIPDIEVINAGIVGFGPDQMLIRFSNEVDKYKPNLVIFHIFADNDFGDIIRNRLFHLDTNGKLVKTGFEATVDAHLLSSQKTFISNLLVVKILEEVKKSLIMRVSSEEQEDTNKQSKMQPEQMKEYAIRKVLEMTEAEYLVYKGNQPRQFSHFADHYDIDIALNPDQESSKMKIRLMQEVLKEANKLASVKGVNMLVMIQPSVIDTTIDNAIVGYKDLQQYPNYRRTNLSGAVEKICELHGIHFINLFDVFVQNNPQDLFFRADDGHWTDRGQQIAAQETAQYINDHSMIKNQKN